MSGLVVDLPIETERLLLRPHRMDDLDDLAEQSPVLVVVEDVHRGF